MNIKASLLLVLFAVTANFAGYAIEPKAPEGKKVKTPRIATKAADCEAASKVTVLEFNNVSARLENGGNMWEDRTNGTPAYEVPKGSGKKSLFAGSLWMGGQDATGKEKVAAVTFRSGEDFWPGPLTEGAAEVEKATCKQYDRFYNAYKPDAILVKSYFDTKYELEQNNAQDIDKTLEALFPNFVIPSYFNEWPAHGGPGQDQFLAPFRDSKYGTKDLYEPLLGDYPGYDLDGSIVCRDQTKKVPLFGDTTIYWIFNDRGNIHTETGGDPIGMEIRAQAFAFAHKSAINNMTFYNYVLINQGTQILTNTYFGQWADADLGNPFDDYVGCDVARGLGYCYNGDNNDDVQATSPGYGVTPPAIGIDFFQGPFQDDDGIDNPGPYDSIFSPQGIKNITYQQAKQGNGVPYRGIGIGYGDGKVDNERFGMTKFLYYNNQPQSDIGDPTVAIHYYQYLQGIWKDGTQFVYGGNAHWSTFGVPPCRGADTTVKCNYMFPGDSDPVGWGTSGRTDLPEWDERCAGNPQGDRRFMQSSGPFTLRPGAVNNITVGVVWARASVGDEYASVEELFRADDIAQGLFDNCFQVFEGPDAPDLDVAELDRELILFISNPSSSNNYKEAYRKARPELNGITDSINYWFEGYQIFQVRDASVSVADLGDVNKARLAFQVDLKNFKKNENGKDILSSPIADIINYEVDPVMKVPVPKLMVQGANAGISHSFRVTKDLFASGADQRLINNRSYCFIAIAYAFNNYKQFDPDPLQPSGQAEPYVASRKNGRGGAIQIYCGTPHINTVENNGTILRSAYGQALPITRYEGTGNGGFNVDMTPESEAAIMTSPNFVADTIKYELDAGPIEVKIVDPLRVQGGDYYVRLRDSSTAGVTASNYMNNGYWELVDATTNTIVATSEKSIRSGGEQLIRDVQNRMLGFSVRVPQHFYSGASTKELTEPVGSGEATGGSWLSGIPDSDNLFSPTNWIRAGIEENDNKDHVDETEMFETILGGTWAPFALTSDSIAGPRKEGSTGPNTAREIKVAYTTSVDIVFTSDKSKWTRSPVIEMYEDATLTEGFAVKGGLRQAPSVDKNGLKTGDPGYNAAEGDSVSATGMGWFPGYAINPETGERLNISFGEASYFVHDNGNDMLFNPSPNVYNNHPDYSGDSTVFGGRHYIFIHKNSQATNKRYAANEVGAFDSGRKLYDNLKDGVGSSKSTYQRYLGSMNWVGLPLLNGESNLKPVAEGLIPEEARIKLRVAKKYENYNALAKPTEQDPFDPKYGFSTRGFEPLTEVTSVGQSGLDLIRVFPNPYYAYSGAEGNRELNRVKFTNLPEQCTISIYSLDGTLVRKFTKDTRTSTKAQTIVEWDLRNFANIPIASGVYIIHIDAPGLGEKVVKWFGVMRQTDLQNL